VAQELQLLVDAGVEMLVANEDDQEETTMEKRTTHKEKITGAHKAAAAHIERAKKEGLAEAVHIDTLLPAGSWQRVAVGVAAAAGGGLVAAALIGVGPVAIAGTAGYLAYRGMTGSRTGTHSEGNGRGQA